MTIEEKIEWLQDAKKRIAYYVISDVRDRWKEFLEAFDDIGTVYDDASDDDKELVEAYHTMLEELEKELETLVFNNI